MDSFLSKYLKPGSGPYSHDATTAPAPAPAPHKRNSFSSPKVVSIPVHFVGSEKKKSAAAVKIQRVFRGFVARKNVKKIAGIKKEVDEIEGKISRREMIDLIRKDGKERLKVSEMLMALLFKLDSISGVDSGVRDCRKMVIKKAIMLQEKLDAIVVSGDETLEKEEKEEEAPPVQQDPNCAESVEGEDIQQELLESKESDLIQGDAIVDESVPIVEDKMKNELVEKMIEKNDILIGMVAELCQRNKEQTQMITSLSKRVDSLEKAFKSEKTKCKKRRQSPNTVPKKP